MAGLSRRLTILIFVAMFFLLSFYLSVDKRTTHAKNKLMIHTVLGHTEAFSHSSDHEDMSKGMNKNVKLNTILRPSNVSSIRRQFPKKLVSIATTSNHQPPTGSSEQQGIIMFLRTHECDSNFGTGQDSLYIICGFDDVNVDTWRVLMPVAIREDPFQSELFFWTDNVKDLQPFHEIFLASKVMTLLLLVPERTVQTKQMAGHKGAWNDFMQALTLETQGDFSTRIMKVCSKELARTCRFVTSDLFHGSVDFGLQTVFEGKSHIFVRNAPLVLWFPQPRIPVPSIRGVLCTLVKDPSNDRLLEWIDFHQQMGFHIALYNHHSSRAITVPPSVDVSIFPAVGTVENDCTKWMKNSEQAQRSHGFAVCQLSAYEACMNTYAHRYAWVANWDVDEFVFIQKPHQNVLSINTTNPVELRLQSDLNTAETFWNTVEKLNTDSLEFQCLKFGSQAEKIGSSMVTQTRLHRAAYEHLGEHQECLVKRELCESVGSIKILSRSVAVSGMKVHSHLLFGGKRQAGWQLVASNAIRCHHYAFFSLKEIKQKALRNNNPFITEQLQAGLFEPGAWFNKVLDKSLSQTKPSAHICVAFLSCMRLEKLQNTYNAIMKIIERVTKSHNLSFMTAIVDNGSDVKTQSWIQSQLFSSKLLLPQNVGIARAMDKLWDLCGASEFILNVEDDWVVQQQSNWMEHMGGVLGILAQSMDLLRRHEDTLEVWLRPHGIDFQYDPDATMSKNAVSIRSKIITPEERIAQKLSYYLQSSSMKSFPWWGTYTNGATLKHAQRLRSVGPMYQDHCGDTGNCESEFASKVSYMGWKAARFCWRGDKCEIHTDNEPELHVMFAHQGGSRSPGHSKYMP
jgi:hypothetical protein